ncbi:MAG: plasmid pRiA4b ORF-3 family protein [Acidobacteriota bacterium]|nr:plasmid pRiA4b ORF-3 family protein [Acidobacteriota bacterium]
MKILNIKKIFLEQTIDENQPATILHDFEIFLNFVAANNLEASGKNELLPLKSLRELNGLLTKPFEIALQRPVQKSFANINGLFLLARASGLLIMQKDDKTAKFAIDREALKIWQSLNPTERYFTLVETWIVRGSVELIGEHHQGMFNSPMYCLVRLFEDLITKGSNVKENKFFQDSGFLLYGSHNIALAEMFGWLEIKHGAGQKGKSWIIEQIKRTDFGAASVALLLDNFKTLDFNWKNAPAIADTEFDENAFNLLQPTFQPYFSNWRNIYRLPTTETKDGIFVFKVSLDKKIWRRIAISSNDVFDDLHDAIQDAFEFDNDHLYEFSFRNRFGITQRVVHPICEEEFSTDKFKIENLPLRIGETMEYVFDFGDYWQFTVELEEIQPPNPKFKKAKILEKHGKSPEQYPSWEDYDE